MRFLFLIFLLLISNNGYCDSESTIGGKTAQSHIIQSSGVSLRPRPYLDFEGITCTDTGGKTVCTGGSGGGGGVGVGTINPGTQNYLSVYQSNSTTLGPSTIPFVDNGTNVGIGSINPTQKLDVIGTVKATKFIGDGSGLSNIPAEISGLTTNFVTKATSATTIGNSQIFDNGTNVGIGTSTNTRSKLDVLGNLDARGNITIKTPTFNTTDGIFQGVGSVGTLFPASQTGAINDIETILPYHQGQLTYTVNGAGSGMALFNGSYLFGYALTVTGITVAPTHNATYNNGVCTQTIFATNLTAGAGTISVHSNCLLSATGTTNKTGGTGDASFSWTASNTLPSYAAGMAFPGGFDGFGDPNHPEVNSDNNNPVFAIGYGQLGRVTPGDTGIHLQCGIYAPFSSGCSWFSDIMNDDGTVRDPVGSQTSDIQGLVPLEFDGGGVMWIFNPNIYNPRVMGISASSGTGLDSGGNFGGYFFDSTDTYNGKLAMRFPHHIAHVHMPGSKSYIFSGITGVTTAPAPNVNQQPEYSISGGTGEHYDWIKNNLSGGAGTITFESRSTPASSGTLTKITVAGIPIGLGDSTIAYTSVAVENTYQDTMYMDLFNGNVGIDTFVPTKQLDVIGTVKATHFIGDGSGLTGISAGGTPGTPLNSVQYNNASAFAGSANFTFDGTNVGIGTSLPTGILSIANQTTNGREFYITGANSTANLDMIRGDPDSKDNGFSIEDNFHTGQSVYTGQTISIQGGGNLCVGCGSQLSTVQVSGSMSIGPFSSSVERAAPSNGLVVSGSVGIGTWLPTGILEVGVRKFNVANSGNVGVGSISPGQILDVVGTVRAINFIGAGTGLTGTAASLTAGAVSTISGLITQGTNVTITGSGTSGSPYNISSSGGGTGSNYWNLSAGNVGINTTNNVGIGTTLTTTSALTVMSGNVGIGTWVPLASLDIVSSSGSSYVSGNLGIGSSNPGAALDITQVGPISATFPTNVGIGTTLPTGALDIIGTVRALSAGSCTTLYRCVGGVDAGVIQTSACVLCPGGSCTQMNGCF